MNLHTNHLQDKKHRENYNKSLAINLLTAALCHRATKVGKKSGKATIKIW